MISQKHLLVKLKKKISKSLNIIPIRIITINQIYKFKPNIKNKKNNWLIIHISITVHTRQNKQKLKSPIKKILLNNHIQNKQKLKKSIIILISKNKKLKRNRKLNKKKRNLQKNLHKKLQLSPQKNQKHMKIKLWLK